ncbi:unnamed protein product [Closterium sp. Naga37s-1]|nr:unnamed protein product [Closterium sp. Naga37s-1]
MSMAWKRIEKEYLDTQRKEGTSGEKAIKKKPWWDYVYHLRKHSAKAKAHALDGGGAATINVDAYASVPAQNDPQSSGAPSPARARGARLQPSTPGVTPPAKRRRIEETATMAAAKLVSEAINSTNASTLRQLQDSTQLLVTAMHMAALQAGLRLQIPNPPAPDAAPPTSPPPAQPGAEGDATMDGSDDGAEEPDR